MNWEELSRLSGLTLLLLLPSHLFQLQNSCFGKVTRLDIQEDLQRGMFLGKDFRGRPVGFHDM